MTKFKQFIISLFLLSIFIVLPYSCNKEKNAKSVKNSEVIGIINQEGETVFDSVNAQGSTVIDEAQNDQKIRINKPFI